MSQKKRLSSIPIAEFFDTFSFIDNHILGELATQSIESLEPFPNGDAVVYLAILEWIGEGKATLHPSEDDLTKVLTSVDDRIQKVEERFHKGSLSQETYISDIANLQEAREYLKELLQTLNAKKPMGPKQHSLTENFDDHV
ncbi:hypothetical protein A2914_00890 [Candidatus Nomurabacteria bacterium RIFCSPLOWO2_01_FULL_41_21]|uniref:Uncharacterized protein n=2 Tax=Candidatus Nomuraibacteriota TaxID=1752729 RepID=A0A1F6V211_9BACT|nr:MAG: hypothetical protein A2733_01980 [Candidatus Nomurabacteria bacterium RIFCSPHIGHO2_01_FULL_40_20]OGI87872.1 MAG: hypothetical protein A2914_00890 [Candidatus Nomurabacteria bacterium RIFCSPLOWO2_01_FULL_41_21]